jgi:hypothetical protein
MLANVLEVCKPRCLTVTLLARRIGARQPARIKQEFRLAESWPDFSLDGLPLV